MLPTTLVPLWAYHYSNFLMLISLFLLSHCLHHATTFAFPKNQDRGFPFLCVIGKARLSRQCSFLSTNYLLLVVKEDFLLYPLILRPQTFSRAVLQPGKLLRRGSDTHGEPGCAAASMSEGARLVFQSINLSGRFQSV